MEFFLSWAGGDFLNSAKTAILAANGGTNKSPGATLSPTAKAVANTAYWLSNSYDYTHKVDKWDRDAWRWTGNWTTTTEDASQARQDNNESIRGTKYSGTAMTQAEAKWYLLHSRASYTSVQIELFTTDYEPRYIDGHPYDDWLDDVWVFARTDSIEQIKQAKLNALKTKYEDQTLYWGHEFEKVTTAYDVGSYEMESKFENVTGHAALSDSSPGDSRANDYKGTVRWTYNEVNPNGTSVYPGEDDHSDYDFKSYEPDTDWLEELCKNYQTLSVAPDINNSARRRFENKGIKSWRRRYGGTSSSAPYIPGSSNWHNVVVEIQRVVVQEED